MNPFSGSDPLNKTRQASKPGNLASKILGAWGNIGSGGPVVHVHDGEAISKLTNYTSYVSAQKS